MQAQEKITTSSLFKTSNRRILEWKEIQDELQNSIIFPKPITLDLIRHAESTINADKRITGSQDVKLTPAGENQAIYLGQKLDCHYNLAFASTLQRSQRTLEVALGSDQVKVEKLLYDERLNERSMGVLEGQRHRWIPEYADGDLKYTPEGGESYEKVAKRVFSFLLDLSQVIRQESYIDSVLISGHMGPMRIMLGILKEEEDPVTVLGLKFSNTEVINLTWKRLQMPGFLKTVIE
ncbi:histidine phosphatase family protein [Oscillatoria amoena NRMC-F 0135]|nr:histidine phosphatase family protein [Desertifilum sp.]MDI9637622.1 histidine phosphatase family protein [Geitlerinema splendidum]MDL5044849.1 histidine phosphatase family protein [Oscillatoria amoena NRMC-F 0135]